MGKVVQISVLGKVYGNVNADEVIGTRVTLKKMYSSGGEVLPFVSARAVKFAIRQALKEQGFEIDPFVENPEEREALRLRDTGNPRKYIDNDLFGYMVTTGRGETARKRQGPIALSYFKAVHDTPIKSEFAARFPRPWGEGKERNPVPFEVEVAEFIGRLNCIMYDYIGRFEDGDELDQGERRKRIQAFLDVFLTPKYVLPRRTNSLNIPEYIASLVTLSEKGPLPVFQYLDYDFQESKVNIRSLEIMMRRREIKEGAKYIFLIDYKDSVEADLPEGIKKSTLDETINAILDFL
ncbi:MAG: type I-B CRISPR-associated protein Cas7/Cst2/DevR [Thermoplasmata archaeon]|nr:MAG: type I-B CRISPR-associated protein Cas7/Cst2/DevR [Thermoplasmata archaeon]